MRILNNILDHKRQEVEARKREYPLHLFHARIERAAAPLSLAAALSHERIAVIAELKKASPSAGVIREQFDPIQIAKSYVNAGANALSILTDEKYFQGSLAYIESVRPTVSIPILRKDFIIDPYQILEARASGADAILLIVAALEQARLRDLLHTAREFRLDVLVEVHTADEIRTAIDIGANMIGINNRNLDTFAIDLATTEQLASLAPPGTILVAESGLRTPADLQRMIDAGVQAVLVGTHFMRHPDPGVALREFIAAAREIKNRKEIP